MTQIKTSLASLQDQTTEMFNVKNFVLHCPLHQSQDSVNPVEYETETGSRRKTPVDVLFCPQVSNEGRTVENGLSVHE